MIWEGCGVLFQKLLGSTEENLENLGQDLIPGPPECEAGVLSTTSQYLVHP
jgi:hypothetical protein